MRLSVPSTTLQSELLTQLSNTATAQQLIQNNTAADFLTFASQALYKTHVLRFVSPFYSFFLLLSYTRTLINHVLCLTLLPFVSSPPSDSWAHTLRDFPPLLQSSSQPATVFKISDCNAGWFSFRKVNPSDRITAAPFNLSRGLNHYILWMTRCLSYINKHNLMNPLGFRS